MNERYPDGSLSHLYDSSSNQEETRLGLSVPIPTPDEVFSEVPLTRLGTPGSELRPKTERLPLDEKSLVASHVAVWHTLAHTPISYVRRCLNPPL
jgi:hypothetical protein